MGNVFVTVDKLQSNAKWIDTRFDLADITKGEQQYKEGHIEGAVYWHLERDLSDMASDDGRHPMPSNDAIQGLIERSGLTFDDAIYIYDQGAAPFAARAWSILTYAGFTKVFIVNGGVSALLEEGYTFTQNQVEPTPSKIVPNWKTDFIVNRQQVKDIVDGKEQATLLDARANVRYRGETEAIDPIAGHIPTAKNFDWEQLKNGTKLIANDKLSQKVAKEEAIVVYCGSGVTASPLFAVLNDNGYENVRLYMGSYSDWIRHHRIETGENE